MGRIIILIIVTEIKNSEITFISYLETLSRTVISKVIIVCIKRIHVLVELTFLGGNLPEVTSSIYTFSVHIPVHKISRCERRK